MFLMQTLQIRIQFTHFLKFASFAHHASKIMKKSVTKKHYIFDSDDLYSISDATAGDERRSAMPRITYANESTLQKKMDRLKNVKK